MFNYWLMRHWENDASHTQVLMSLKIAFLIDWKFLDLVFEKQSVAQVTSSRVAV